MSNEDHRRSNAEDMPNSGPFSEKDTAAYGDDTIHRIHQQLAREKEEPTEGFSPVPIFLLFLFGGLVFWAGIYLANGSGNFLPGAFTPDFKVGDTNKTAVAFDPLKRGERLYKNNCAACHQANGQGVAGAFPPLANSAWVTGDESRFTKILLRGLQGPIVVNGEEYNGNMPSYGENGLGWSDRDLHAILTYTRQAWDNDAPPVTEETVAAVRAEIAGKNGAWSAAELLSAHPME
ncbi:cytochrome c [Rubellicoccus peritrichatus]|uniref:Cytochrome c n=1 Tax=Rubellicoccus peritrichatus TaxID=3080537 RepID=A0AAQ3QXG2_9BACT|nr:cytochrome c [Puniceicoccus sp. CR14]WOO43653.1 cytochrome c [Puniceicoccus sp. CR14]